MLGFVKRILNMAGEYAGRIKLAFVLSFFENMLSFMPILAALYIFTKIVEGTLTTGDAWLSGGIMLAAVAVRCVLRRLFVALQSGTGYEICARERINSGDRFKRFPMSYFTEGNLGNVASAISVDLLFIEEHGMGAMDKVINGYMGMLLGSLLLFGIDWRIALVSVGVCAMALLALNRLQTTGKEQSKIKQSQQAKLTAAVIEYVQGISVIKSLNMAGDKAKSIKDTIESTRDHAIDYEEKFTPPSFRYQICFSAGIALIVFCSLFLF